MRFIIADDSSISRDIARGILVRAGHEVVATASTGLEAVDLCRELHPDGVVLDISMPAMSGLVAAKIIAAEHLAPLVIVVSIVSTEPVQRQVRALGGVFVAKPYSTERLLDAIGGPTMEAAR